MELTLEKKTVEKTFSYKAKIGDRSYSANINFRDEKFVDCEYYGCNLRYDLSDWRFVQLVSIRIHELTTDDGMLVER